MAADQNQALVQKFAYALYPLNDALNAAYAINHGLPHTLFNVSLFGRKFQERDWMTALIGPNEVAVGTVQEDVVVQEVQEVPGGNVENTAGGNLAVQGGGGALAHAARAQARRRLRPPGSKRQQMTRIKKNVYLECSKAALRSSNEVDAYREANGVSVTGRGAPKPIMDIQEAGFPADLIEPFQATGLGSFSGLHGQCWPVSLSGRDLFCIVNGKAWSRTLCYLLPAIVHIRNQEPPKPRDGPILLVLAPTRQSGQEIEKHILEIEKYTNIRSVVLSSGVPKEPQLKQLQTGAQICLATPSRLVAFLQDGDVNLRRCSCLIVDGADRMIAMGLEKELRTIAGNIRPDRQTLFWVSSRSLEIDHLAEELLTDPVIVTVETSQPFHLSRLEHTALVCEPEDREEALIDLFQDSLREESDKVVVFVGTRQRADSMAVDMQNRNWPAVSIHGTKTKKERDWALEAFRRGTVPILVATDIGSRELDTDGVRFVVNYDQPAGLQDYIRRIKHAVRVDGAGKAYTFLAPSDSRHAKQLISIMREAKQDIPRDVLNVSKKKTA